jgi:hypothetical protein
MGRLIPVVTLTLLLISIPVVAQRGGRGSAGGGRAAGGMHSGASMGARGLSHGGMSRGFSGRSSGRSFGGFSGRSSHNFSRNNFPQNRSRGLRSRSFGFGNCLGCRRGRYGYRYQYPWGYAGFYDPYWWWDSGSSYDEDRARELDQANQMNAQSLEEQQMRREQDQDVYSGRDPQPHEAARAEAPEPATVLVFRDQRKQEVQNYAIVGQTLWSFSGQRTQKIPIADLDLAATAKANDERGVNFKVPAGGM